MTKRTSSSNNSHEQNAAAAKTNNLRVTEAVDAVCDELGISDRRGRALIARRVSEAYARGSRQPLNLVHAGLNA